MSVEQVAGNLFTYPGLDSLGQGVNCEGVMGRGIAKGFRDLDEGMYRSYRELCLRGGLGLGGLHTWKLADGRWVYNLASQFQRGPHARIHAIASSLDKALEHAVEHEVTSLGLPQIGCGIGGLHWPEVLDAIEQVSARFPVRIVVVEYAG